MSTFLLWPLSAVLWCRLAKSLESFLKNSHSWTTSHDTKNHPNKLLNLPQMFVNNWAFRSVWPEVFSLITQTQFIRVVPHPDCALVVSNMCSYKMTGQGLSHVPALCVHLWTYLCLSTARWAAHLLCTALSRWVWLSDTIQIHLFIWEGVDL